MYMLIKHTHTHTHTHTCKQKNSENKMKEREREENLLAKLGVKSDNKTFGVSG